MTNAQLYFAIGLPCFTIVTSLIISLVQVPGVRDSIREIREDIRNSAQILNSSPANSPADKKALS
jgi:hypothetical protein